MDKSNRIWVFSLFMFCHFALHSQEKHDFVWILGYNPNLPEFFVGGNYIDFQSGNPTVNYFDIPFDMDNPVVMADSMGRLQFYSSGCNVINREHEIMENGDDLSPGFFHDYWCDQADWGYLSYQGILSLPAPGNPGQYILFHNRQFENNDSIDVLYTIIDMNANGGLGKVTEKNKILQYGGLSRTFQATRHGNGRDWWVVIPHESKDIYNFYLLDPAGIHGPFIQQVSDSWIPGQYYNLMCAFSPDGSKFVRLGGDKPTAFRLYNFDRCNGTLSSPVTINVPDTIMYAASACFSPSSRYLYVTNEVYRLYQYDTEVSDIDASVQLIGEYDGFVTVYNLAAGPHAMMLAPDNRIYLSSGNGVNVLHTIHNPDLPGANCDFRLHDILLPAHILFFLPNNPFFRLYALKGSSCDTLGVKPPITAFWRLDQDSMAGVLQANFVDLSYFKPVSWTWDFGDGTNDTAQSPTHLFPAPGTYNVCLTACNEIGDCNTLCQAITMLSVGMHEPITSRGLRLYPNPVDEELCIEGNISEGRLEVIGSSGIVYQNIKWIENNHCINVRDLSPGLYFLLFFSADGHLQIGKFVLAR